MGRMIGVVMLLCWAARAEAHASEQGFVLLLPTTLYAVGGLATVALTFLLVLIAPTGALRGVFRPVVVVAFGQRRRANWASFIAFIGLIALIFGGFYGPHDPTRNMLPLMIWAVFWVVIVVAQGVFGDIWRWINPWSGPYEFVRKLGARPILRLPVWVGYWPAIGSFLAISMVLLAHPAPADPDELAWMVLCYWGVHFAGMIVFGPRWLKRGEGITVLCKNYASIAIFGRFGGRVFGGVWGWKRILHRAPDVSLASFMVITLAIGSFDGVNETFWWLVQIGINPLEFPGRSAVIWQNLAGLGAAVLALLAVYGGVVWCGVRIARGGVSFGAAYCAFAPTVLPIALAYHFSHYFPSFLVEGQYVTRSFLEGTGIGTRTVTTGFFNSLASMRAIWLFQAGAVVLGHVIAIVLSHVLAMNLFSNHRKAALSQIPLAVFMIGYTVLGLWLLASPRGG